MLVGRVMGFEPTIFWATTRRVNHYTTPATSEKCYHMWNAVASGQWSVVSDQWPMTTILRLKNSTVLAFEIAFSYNASSLTAVRLLVTA